MYYSLLASLALLVIGSVVLYQQSQERSIQRVHFNNRIILSNLEETLIEEAHSAQFILHNIDNNIVNPNQIDSYLKESSDHSPFIDHLFLLDKNYVITHSFPYKKRPHRSFYDRSYVLF